MMPLLVPAGGRGNRAIPQTDYIPKALLKMDGKTLVECVLDVAFGIGVKDVYVVVGYMGDMIVESLGEVYSGMRLHYIRQEEQKGLVHAMSMAKDSLSEPFMMMLSDEIYWGTRHDGVVPYFNDNDFDALCCIMRTSSPEKIKKNYSVEIDGGRIRGLVEKPKEIVNDLMGTGTCVFKPCVFDYIDSTAVNPQRKEKELTDLVQTMINDGKSVGWFDLKGDYINVNTGEDYRILLSRVSDGPHP